MGLDENLYWIFNTPYYRIKIVKDMEVIKTITQKIASQNDKNISDFLISYSDRKAWSCLKNFCFRDGKAFECYADIDNAIPLVEETKITSIKTYMAGLITREVSMTVLKNTSAINFGKDVEIKKMKEITISPEFVFRQIDQKFAKDVLSADEFKLDKKYILAALVIIAALYVWFVVLGGKLPF